MKTDATSCGNCCYWKQHDDEFNEKRNIVGVGECTRIHPLWEAAEWIDDAKEGEPAYRLTEDGKQSSAFVQDGSEYMATLFTKPDFSCKLWMEIPHA
jgi:hypothetical protein